MQSKSQPDRSASYVMTSENITSYLQHEMDRGASKDSIRSCRRTTSSLFEWLPADKVITKERLLSWRQSLKDHGYTSQTEQNYIKNINRYLDYIGCTDIRFNRGKAKDIAGKQFGYLTAIEPTGEKDRKNYIWRCKCNCGNEIELPATRLLTGNTLSCGCLQIQKSKAGNKYIDGTCLSIAKNERIVNPDNISGYVGVTPKRGKWQAYIKYKGVAYNLGVYSNLDDAVKARARAKEAVIEDAALLEAIFDDLHSGIHYPDRETVRSDNQVKKEPIPPQPTPIAVRSNNTSGYAGVSLHRKRWVAKITHNKITYRIGSYLDKDSAIAARQKAQTMLRNDPDQFVEIYREKAYEPIPNREDANHESGYGKRE